MNKIKQEILETFEEVKFLPGKDKYLVGYAEMFGNDCIPLYKNINYMPCSSSKEVMAKMCCLNNKAKYATGYESSLIGHLKLDNGTFIYLHEKKQIINKLIKEYSKDTSGLFNGEEDIETSAFEMYEFNIIGSYMDGIPAFAILYSE